jgi:hypothetical protein
VDDVIHEYPLNPKQYRGGGGIHTRLVLMDVKIVSKFKLVHLVQIKMIFRVKQNVDCQNWTVQK